jgi:hypothetical protein
MPLVLIENKNCCKHYTWHIECDISNIFHVDAILSALLQLIIAFPLGKILSPFFEVISLMDLVLSQVNLVHMMLLIIKRFVINCFLYYNCTICSGHTTHVFGDTLLKVKFMIVLV